MIHPQAADSQIIIYFTKLSVPSAWSSKTLGWLGVCTGAPEPHGSGCLAEGCAHPGHTGKGSGAAPEGLRAVKHRQRALQCGDWTESCSGSHSHNSPRAQSLCSSEIYSCCSAWGDFSSILHGQQEGNISRRIKFQ